MKCPHCQYLDGVDPEQNYKKTDGDVGEFYHLPVKIERDEKGRWDRSEQKTLFACPKCGKAFIEVGF